MLKSNQTGEKLFSFEKQEKQQKKDEVSLLLQKERIKYKKPNNPPTKNKMQPNKINKYVAKTIHENYTKC